MVSAMFNLPISTVYGKRIPKQRFYDSISVSPQLKRSFIEQVSAIIWTNKIAPSTLNIAPGSVVDEIEVFEVRLYQPSLDRAVLEAIDSGIPYHILFILTCGGEAQAWICYKEVMKGSKTGFKLSAYYHTAWMDQESLSISLDGISVDAVYERLVRQVAGDALELPGDVQEEIPLQQRIVRSEQREKLKKQIASLEKRVNTEKQYNRRVEMNMDLKVLKNRLEGLS